MSDAFADQAPVLAGEPALVGTSPWVLARRRLLRNRVAMAMVGVLVVIVALCLAAPLYAKYVAHTNPFESHLTSTTIVNGKRVPVMQPAGVAHPTPPQVTQREPASLRPKVTWSAPDADPAHHGCANRPEDNPGVDDRHGRSVGAALAAVLNMARFS
jgi:N-terminal TM domain of oligopeptide transport permease C